MAAGTAGKKASTAFGFVEVWMWAFFTLSPFLLVAGYLLYNGGASVPPMVESSETPPRTQSIAPYPPLPEGKPHDTVGVTVPSGEEKAWSEYQKKLAQLRLGMNLEQVQKILGLRCKELISAKTSVGPRVTYEWELFGGFKVTGTFRNNRLEKYEGV